MTLGLRTTTSPVEASGELGTVGVEYPDLLAWQGEPDGAGASWPGDRVEGGGAGCFGESVALDEREAVPRLEAGQQVGGRGRGAADPEANRRHVGIDVGSERREHGVDGRHRAEVRRSLAFDHVEEGSGVEAVGNDDAGARRAAG